MITIIVKPTSADEKAVRFYSDDPAASRDCVAAVKKIPAPFRRFDPAAKVWYVDADAAWELENFLGYMRAAHRADVRRDDVRQGGGQAGPHRRAGSLTVEGACEALTLTPGALRFPALVRAAHRALAAELHPDRAGGDAERMKGAGAAYDLPAKRIGAA